MSHLWFNSYLTNKKQRVALKNSNYQTFSSDWLNIKVDVPQGSILGPLLTLYT